MKKSIPKDLFTRGVAEFVDPDGEFRKKLEKNPEKVVIKFGVDPTRPDLHIGHAVVLRKLRQFQELGCKVVFLVGDFTALIGDPTGKSKVRPEQDFESINRNMLTYLAQVGKILNVNIDTNSGEILESDTFSWIRNSDWFMSIADITTEGASEKMLLIKNSKGQELSVSPDEYIGKAALFDSTRMQKQTLKLPIIQTVSVINLLATLRTISHSRLIERDMFAQRIKNNEPLFMNEMLYPVFQGLDSNLIYKLYGSCDLEVGGTDQTFNMLMGRDVMKINEQPLQAVMSFDILEGLDGKEKMSKSLDNYVGMNDEPNNMYGKLLSIPDNLIVKYFTLCTNLDVDEIKTIAENLVKGTLHPKDAKMHLAREIVTMYHSADDAKKAEESFQSTFAKGEIPKDTKTVTVNIKVPLVDILMKQGLVASKSEFRRLVQEGAITFHGEIEEKKIIDPASLVDQSGALKIGKRRFLKITVKKNNE